MPFWFTLLFYAGIFLVSELLKPKPNIENAKPAALGDFQFPTAEEGRSVPVFWGTVRINGPNLGWFGDLETKPIKQKIKTGLFSSEKQVVGFKYFVGVQFLLGQGDFENNGYDGIGRIWVDDELLVNAGNEVSPETWVQNGTIDINEPEFFGTNGGGIVGTVRVFPGTVTQGQSSYLAGVADIDSTLLPAYRGTIYVLLERVLLGNAPSIRPWNFEARRIPNGLGLGASSVIVNNRDANLMNVLYEVLTNTVWGLGLDNIDTANLTEAAITLANEGNGYSRLLDRPIEASELVREIEQQADGVLRQDPVTKSYQFKLIRQSDYPSPLSSLPRFDLSNTLSFDFSRKSWSDTVNAVRVQYTDPEKNYKASFALAQDMANREIQGGDNVVTTIVYPGIQNKATANDVAWRDLRTLSYPLGKGKLKTTRENYSLRPGDLAVVDWGPLNISNLYVRINRVQLGTLEANEILYDVTEDIFEAPSSTFADPPGSLWNPVVSDAVDVVAARVFDLPAQYSDNSSIQQYGVIAARANGLQVGFLAYYAETASPSTPADSAFELNVDVAPFTPTGLLVGALPLRQNESPMNFDDDTIVIDNTIDIDEVSITATLADLDNDSPPNLILVDDEIMFFESLTDLGGGQYQLNNVHRGMLDTVPADHADNARVWFFSYSIGLLQAVNPTVGNYVHVAFVSSSIQGDQTVADAVKTSVVASNRYLGAAPAVNPEINGIRINDFDVDTLSGGLLQTYWKGRNVGALGSRERSQESSSEDPGPSASYSVRVYHTGVSPEVLKLTRTGIPYAGSGISPEGAQFNAQDFLYDPETVSPLASPRIPQTYRVEIESVRGGYTSQVWESADITVTGYGLSFGGTTSEGVVLDPGDATPSPLPANPVEGGYGGINFEGVVLNQGAPPLVVEPVPGLENEYVVNIDVLGTYNSNDSYLFDVQFFNNVVGQYTTFSFTINAASYSTLEEIAAAIAGECTDNLPADVTSVSLAGTRVTLSTFYGSLKVDALNTAVLGALGVAEGSLRQASAGSSTPLANQAVYLDYWDTLNGVDVLAPSQDAVYGQGGFVTSRIEIRGLTYDAQKQVSESDQPSGGYLVLGQELAVGNSYTGVMQSLYDALLSSGVDQFVTIAGPLVLASGGPAPDNFPQPRASIRLTARDNFAVTTQSYATVNPNTSHDYKLLWKEGRVPAVVAPTGLPQVVHLIYAQSANVVAGDVYVAEVAGNRVTETATTADATNNNLERIYDALAASLIGALPSTYTVNVLRTIADIARAIEVIGPDNTSWDYTVQVTHGPAGVEIDIEEIQV